MGRFGQKVVADGFGVPAGLIGHIGGRLMAGGNGATERHIAELTGAGPDDTVLVVGPGPGVGVRALLDRSAGVVAVDPSPVMLEQTLRRCRDLCERGASLTVRTGTAEDHGAGRGTVDIAVSVNNVMIWPDRLAGLRKIAEALRPGGRLFVSAHAKWLDPGLADDCRRAGFEDVSEWRWEPPGRGASTAVQVRAVRSPAG